MRWLWGAVLSGVLGGCGPWVTNIPTYWPPELRPRRSRVDERLTLPPAVAPRAPRVVAAEISEPEPKALVIPEDTPAECRAVYVVTAQNNLYAFEPETNAFELRGVLRCPDVRWASPFSMAVARDGIARVIFNDGRMFQVDVADASCNATGFQRGQHGYYQFGMGYAPDGDGGESLYVAEISFARPSKGLARIDTDTGALEPIGAFSINPGNAIELTPSGSGPLFGFFINEQEPGGTLVEIDTASGAIRNPIRLDVGHRAKSLAVSWFGGYFYIFTSQSGGSQVTRYDPQSTATLQVASTPETIVGAGVSTCAPDRLRPSARAVKNR
jgi:hypothetical protein